MSEFASPFRLNDPRVELSFTQFRDYPFNNHSLFTSQEETDELAGTGILRKVVRVIQDDYPDDIKIDRRTLRAGFQRRRVEIPDPDEVSCALEPVTTTLIVAFDTITQESRGDGLFQLPVTRRITAASNSPRYMLGTEKGPGPKVYLTHPQSQVLERRMADPKRSRIAIPELPPLK